MRLDAPTEALAVATPNIYIITRDLSQAYMHIYSPTSCCMKTVKHDWSW